MPSGRPWHLGVRSCALPSTPAAFTHMPTSPRSMIRPAATATLAMIAGLWLWTSLVAIANFAFRYPAFDQFRLYRIYLGLPFPANAVQLENGHRPILPALVRLAEIRSFGADQILQTLVGVGALLLALGLIVATLARERKVPAVSRAAACVLATLALLWLGNARMLMHGNELVHAYFVVLFTVLALLATYRASVLDSGRWLACAAACCVAATFSFGTGIASFAGLFVVAALLRLRLRLLVFPALLLVAALATYLFGLPGSGSVHSAWASDPFTLPASLTRWLAAPWMRAWLGYADPPLEPWLQASAARQAVLGAGLVASARGIASLFGNAWLMREGVAVGTCGLAAYAALLVHAARFRGAMSGSRALAVGISTFGLAAGVLVCVARVSHMAATPTEVFADRYLPWSCLFWCGLALYVVTGAGMRPHRREALSATLAVAAALALLPSDRALAGWGATAHRRIQQSAVAAQLGIWDEMRFPDGADATRADVIETLGKLKQNRLSMFAEPAAALIENGWRAPAQLPVPLTTAHAKVVREFHDPRGQRRVAAIEGRVPRIAGRSRDATLVVVDETGALRGLAKFSFMGPNRQSLRFTMPAPRGFDGYVLDPLPGERLHVLVLDPSASDALAAIDLRIPGGASPLP